jgi:Glycosyl hydrolases family 43
VSGPVLAPPARTPATADPPSSTRRARRRRRRLVAGVLAAIALALVGTAVGVNLWLRQENSETVAALDTTRDDTDQTRQRLERVATMLQLRFEQTARAEQASGLAQLDLGRLQGTLSSAQDTLAAQGIQVDALSRCLDGVRSSVELQRAGNDPAAIDALRGIEGACNRALGAIGGTGPVYALDFADPFVLTTNDGYYAYATNSGGGAVQVIRSADLHDWTVVGDGMPVLPDWAEPGLTWAPTVLARGSSFVLYYTVRDASTGRQCVSRGVARTPAGPFRDDSPGPLVCEGEWGAIDASPFADLNGNAYLYWRSDGIPGRITAQRLSLDGRSLVGEPQHILYADESWEDGVIEGPAMTRSGRAYHLFYSGNEWNSRDYAIGHAVCETPLGPCTKPSDKPLFASGGTIAGPGGQEIFLDAAGGARFAYHAFTEPYVGYPASRRLHLATVSFSGPRIAVTPG